MTFPVVQTTAQNNLSGRTLHTYTLPSGVQVGDLLLVFFATDGDNTITNPGSYTILDSESNGTAAFGAILYKIATGSDLVTITTSVSEPSSCIIFRIDGWESTFAPELSTVAENANANPNSTIVTPTWDTDDTLWICSIHVDRNRTIAFYPPNYTGNNLYETGGSAGSCSVATATRNLNTPSQDPSQWTLSASDQWIAWTIAIAPSGAQLPVGGEYSGKGVGRGIGRGIGR